MEFWRDEPFQLCRNCKAEVRNPRVDLGCAKWCKYATECLGHSASDPDVPVVPFRDRLVAALKVEFGADAAQVGHARKVLAVAEQLQAIEGGVPVVVRAAALLRAAGTAGASRQPEAPDAAALTRQILNRLGLEPAVVAKVCEIVAARGSVPADASIEARVVWDAERYVAFPGQYPGLSESAKQERVQAEFRTAAGLRLALETL
jgi:hypothetical protein